MKSLKKISREQLKEIHGGGGVLMPIGCSGQCCPRDGRPRCRGLYCPDVVCPEYI